MNKFDKIMSRLFAGAVIVSLVATAQAAKINAPGDINNFAPAVVSVMGVNNAASATKLATARTLALTGDISGSCSFDGTANCSITANLPPAGTAGTYGDATDVPVFTTDAKGRVTAVTVTPITFPTVTNITGNAGTATALQTARTIDTLTGDVTTPGCSFDGTANCSVAATLATTQPAVHTWSAAQTFNSPITVSQSVSVTGAAGTNRFAAVTQTSGVNRWLIYADSTAESGSNAGSNLQIAARDDSGNGINTTQVARATGAWTFPSSVAVNGTAMSLGTNAGGAPTFTLNGANATYRSLQMLTAGGSRWNFGASGTSESGSNVGSDLVFNAYSDAGAYLYTPLTITRSTGIVAMSKGFTSNSASTVTNGAGQILLSPTGDLTVYRSGGASGVVYFNSAQSHYLYFDGSNFNLTDPTIISGNTVINTSSSVNSLSLTDTGSNGVGIKMTGNGTTTQFKWIRVNNGNFQIVNSAYSNTPMTMTDAGNVTFTGTLSATNVTNAWTAFTPTLSCTAGALTTASASGAYLQMGKTVFIRINIAITTNGTCATTLNAGSIPVAPKAVTTITGRENAVTGKMVEGTIGASGTTMGIQNYDNSYPGANSASIVLNGVYESN